MHEKHIARGTYLEPSQRYMMELFSERANDFMSLSCFRKNYGSKYVSELQR